MAGRTRPLRLQCAPAVALIEYIAGYVCIWVTLFAFYSEKTATLLRAIDGCRQSRKVGEVEFCLLHALEPGRSLLFDWLLDAGFLYSEDGHWLVWRSPRGCLSSLTV